MFVVVAGAVTIAVPVVAAVPSAARRTCNEPGPLLPWHCWTANGEGCQLSCYCPKLSDLLRLSAFGLVHSAYALQMEASPLASKASDPAQITAGPSDLGNDSVRVVEHLTVMGRPMTYSWSGRNELCLRPVMTVPIKPSKLDIDGGCEVNTIPEESLPSVPVPEGHDAIAQQWALDTLSTDISPDILRGVSIKIVLEDLGKAFSGNVRTASQSEFMKSGPVKSLDDFISHDWTSTRFEKVAALVIVHNSSAALIISMCIGVLLAALQSESVIGVLPYPKPEVIDHKVGGWGCWCQCVCPFVFMYILVYWQDVRVKLGFPARKVFLDKLCVDQVDPKRKAEAILGLAGFLNKTDRLVICWAQRYFTRLWCVYEIASWLHLQKSLDNIVFIPLALAKAIFALHWTCVFSTIAFALGQYMSSLNGIVAAVVILGVGPWYTQSFRHMIRDLRNLPRQLRNFSMDTADCYCCQVDHRIPDTGQEIPCDRQVVHRTVKKWFPKNHVKHPCSTVPSNADSGMHTTSSATHFDERVRDLFGPFILQRAGPTQIRYKYCVVIGIPYMWRLLDVIVAYDCWDVPLQVKLSKILEYCVCTFCIIPTAAKISLWYYFLLDSTFGSLRSPVLDWLMSMAFFLPQGFALTASNIPMAAALDERNWLLFYAICGLFVIATAFSFLPVRASLGRESGQDDDGVAEVDKQHDVNSSTGDATLREAASGSASSTHQSVSATIREWRSL